MINVWWSYSFVNFDICQNIAYLCLGLTGDLDIVMVLRLSLSQSSSISMDCIQGANAHFAVCNKIYTGHKFETAEPSGEV